MDAPTSQNFCQIMTQEIPPSTITSSTTSIAFSSSGPNTPYSRSDIALNTYNKVSSWFSNMSPETLEDGASKYGGSEDDGLENEDSEDEDDEDDEEEDGNSEDEDEDEDEEDEDKDSLFRNAPATQQTTSSNNQDQQCILKTRLRITKIDMKISTLRKRTRLLSIDLMCYYRTHHKWWIKLKETQLYSAVNPRKKAGVEALLHDYRAKIHALRKERSRQQMILYSESGTFERAFSHINSSTGQDEAVPAKRRISLIPC
ncbi:hypothetical protein F4678DRAFT_479627 [Xylaria arbuscula]|nr:hypothetical protein F4678DRAFT_479627 [Xylaria arbuscula]